jgi:hypothetical protein
MKKAAKNTKLYEMLKKNEEVRIWLVAGSGGIAQAIHKAFPKATLYILLTGAGIYKKKVIEWVKTKTNNVFIIKNELLLNDQNQRKNRINYYSSFHNYDDLML